MSKSLKFEVLSVGGEGKPKKEYMFDPEAEYQGKTFMKFQRKTTLREGVKWQTLTVSPDDWPAFAEWMEYVLGEMIDQGPSAGADDVPY